MWEDSEASFWGAILPLHRSRAIGPPGRLRAPILRADFWGECL